MKDILEEIYDRDTIFETDADDDKDILKEVFNNGVDILEKVSDDVKDILEKGTD